MSKPELGQAKQAAFQNLREDNLKIRAVAFRNRKQYTRKNTNWKKEN